MTEYWIFLAIYYNNFSGKPADEDAMPRIMVTLLVCIFGVGVMHPHQVLSASPVSNGISMLKQNLAEKGVSTCLEESNLLNDDAVLEGVTKGTVAAGTIAASTVSAAVAGAGSLAGYAGMASAVSSLGLGPVTTLGASLLGSSATGAAATAVCTAFVGGPVVMGGLVVGAVGATGYGLYKGAGYASDYLKNTSPGRWTADKAARAWDWLKSKW